MYEGLGIHWASSVPAFLALACVPFPFVFYKCGRAVRLRCKFAAEAARQMAEMDERDSEIEAATPTPANDSNARRDGEKEAQSDLAGAAHVDMNKEERI
jgi:hypothetical protein